MSHYKLKYFRFQEKSHILRIPDLVCICDEKYLWDEFVATEMKIMNRLNSRNWHFNPICNIRFPDSMILKILKFNLVKSTLKFDINLPVSYSYLRRYCRIINYSMPQVRDYLQVSCLFKCFSSH